MLIKIKSFISKQIFEIKNYGPKELFRKSFLLVKILLRSPIFIIAILPNIIFRLISPIIIVRIGKIRCANFGDFASNTAMYYCKKKLKINLPKKRYIDLIYLNYHEKVFNKQLAKMWKRKLFFFPGFLLDPISKVNKYIPGWQNHTIDDLTFKAERDTNNIFLKCKPLEFTNEEEILGKKILNKFGLKDKDKFVCLAVRDNAYNFVKSPSTRIDFSYHDYRNADIDNFVLCAEELTKRGYYVFRVGVAVEKPLNSKNSKIIDYANSYLRSDFMDVYLGANCSFCISTGLGFQDIPYVFGKPIVQLSLPFGDLLTFNEKFILLSKHHFFKRENRTLSLSEIFSHGVAYAYETKIFEDKEIRLIDHTPEEIRDAAIEMVDILESKNKPSSEDEELQKTFKNLYALNLKRFDYRKEIKFPPRIMHGEIKSRYSTAFLRKNKNWLR